MYHKHARASCALLCLVAAIMAAAPGPISAYPSRYAFGLSMSQYLAMASTNAARGYRPISLDANGPTNNPNIAVVWINDGFTNWTTVVGVTRAQYATDASSLSSQGYRPICLHAYGVSPNECYLAVWVKDSYVSSGWAEVYGLSDSAFGTAWDNYSSNGYRPIWISVIGTNGSPIFAGVWVKDGAGYWTYWDTDAAGFGTDVTNILAQGGRPVSMSGYGPASAMLFGGNWIWADQPVWTWNYQLTAAEFQTAATNLVSQGYRPSFITEYGPSTSPLYASSWVQDPAPPVWTVTGLTNSTAAAIDTEMSNFMTLRHISRGAVAVTYKSRMVFHHAYTYAPAGEAPTQLTNLFRIASLTKAFTSAGILQLIQAGKITIDQPISTILNLTNVSDTRFQKVTIRELLQHWGGWDRSISFDPMFYDFQVSAGTDQPLPTTPQMIIDFMKGVSLDHDPGTVYAYSNFGYCLLGRIIEAITGVPYDQYIQTNVLHPAGIWDMILGKPLLTNANAAEVDYDDALHPIVPTVMGSNSPPYVPLQYGGWNISSMDSHGAWLATAADLVCFSSSYDVPTNSPLLSFAMFNLMCSIPPYPAQDPTAASYYGAGWLVRPEGGGTYNLWHDGDLDGTFTYTVRLANGVCWATVFNQRDDIGDQPSYDNIDPEMNAAVGSVASWPAYDLFDSNGDGLLDAWQIYYFGSISSPDAAPDADPDGDGANNLNEYINLTDPTNPHSYEALYAAPGAPNSQSFALSWMASRGRLYTIETTSNLVSRAWQALPAATSVVGDNTMHSVTNSGAASPSFYRLQVQLQRQ